MDRGDLSSRRKPIIRYIKFIGMSGVAESKLKKEAGLEIGEALDPHRVKEAQRAMESYYHENGFPEAYVEIKEGDKLQDRGVVFLVNEGLKQSYWSTVFEGNQIATDARLKTQIESKLVLCTSLVGKSIIKKSITTLPN